MTVDVDLYHLAKVVFIRFLYCKITLSPPPSIPCSLEGSHRVRPTLKE